MKITSSDLDKLHDAYLTGVQIGQGSVDLSFKLEVGTSMSVRATKVARSRITDFLEGNIVFDARLISERKEISEWLRWLMENRLTQKDDQVSKLSDLVVAGKLALLVVTPSYGATLAVLAEDFTGGQDMHP